MGTTNHAPFPPQKKLGARLKGRTATQRSKKGSENVLGRVLGSQKGSEKGACCGFYSKKGFSEGVLRRQFPEGAQNGPTESTPLACAKKESF